ncbi:hypothetical protein MMC18_005623 [Xylographa bjoerkii]|nr:hypothetical protein [Xylographa bjoerkii]
MTMVDFDPFQLTHRKPIAFQNNRGGIQPLTKIVPDSYIQAMGQQQPASRTHSHSRAVSSAIFPTNNPMSSSPSSNYQQSVNTSRRTPSNATASSTMTTSTTNGMIPTRTSSTVSINLRRSTSSRSGQSMTPTSYVALMRKQKATVWCDRSQHEDPRMLAQVKAAKMRAAMEIIGGNAQGRSSMSGSMGSGSLGVRSKIRHHGTSKGVGYSSANLVGSGVPMRLSASEVGDEDNSDDDTDSQRNPYHQRSGSGRSSLVSNQRLAASNQRPPGRLSQGSTPPSGQGSSPAEGLANLAETAETPVPGMHQKLATGDYFQQASGDGGSAGSSEREASFGNVGDMNAPQVSSTRKENGKSAEELSRRGSVDERAATMRGAVRLFVANPDLSD